MSELEKQAYHLFTSIVMNNEDNLTDYQQDKIHEWIVRYEDKALDKEVSGKWSIADPFSDILKL